MQISRPMKLLEKLATQFHHSNFFLLSNICDRYRFVYQVNECWVNNQGALIETRVQRSAGTFPTGLPDEETMLFRHYFAIGNTCRESSRRSLLQALHFQHDALILVKLTTSKGKTKCKKVRKFTWNCSE